MMQHLGKKTKVRRSALEDKREKIFTATVYFPFVLKQAGTKDNQTPQKTNMLNVIDLVSWKVSVKYTQPCPLEIKQQLKNSIILIICIWEHPMEGNCLIWSIHLWSRRIGKLREGSKKNFFVFLLQENPQYILISKTILPFID